MEDTSLLENDLVRAYRKFEEDFIFSATKVGKPEKISHVDARKVRWILIYCIYQAICSVTQLPSEVRHTRGVPYHLSIATDLLPPWKEERLTYPPASFHRGILPRQTPSRGRAMSMFTSSSSSEGRGEWQPPFRMDTEIKPDIDYFALTRSAATTIHNSPINSGCSTPIRSRSLTRSISRSNTIRRSLSIFSKHGRSGSPSPSPRQTSATTPQHRRRPSYHEIVVHGYGNGTNSVHVATEYVAGPRQESSTDSNPSGSAANRSLSNASKSSDGSAASAATTLTSATVSTAPSSTLNTHESTCPKVSPKSFTPGRTQSATSTLVATSSTSEPVENQSHGRKLKALRIPLRSSSVDSVSRRRHTSYPILSGLADYATYRGTISMAPMNTPKGPRNRFRKTISGLEDLFPLPAKSPSMKSTTMYSSPLRMRPDYSNLRVDATEEWHEVQEAMEKKFKKGQPQMEGDIRPMWEQFTDLGGFTKVT